MMEGYGAMIDLHCHILPGIDDGAASAEIACAMAEHAWQSGVTAIVATPHCNLPGFRHNYRGEAYAARLDRLRELLQQRSIPIRLLPGAEVFADPENIRDLIAERRLITLNHSRYLLVEFDFGTPPQLLCRTLDAIRNRGLIPVIAHPERYAAVQDRPALAAQWFYQGYLLQLNKGSLLGLLGRRAMETGRGLLAHGLAHVIASDAHDDVRPDHRLPLAPAGTGSPLPPGVSGAAAPRQRPAHSAGRARPHSNPR